MFVPRFWRRLGAAAWRVLKVILMVALVMVALLGIPLGVIGRRPECGPPRQQGAVTQVHK